jgi:Uma2 family endonuclease
VLEYRAAGTRLVWVVEPRDRLVTTYSSRTDVRVQKGEDTLDGFDVLPGFRLRVADVFAPPEFPAG